jgi:3-hydroxy acid dehydrogenase / malonic semialdehyde reductase
MQTFTADRKVVIVTGASSGIGREIVREAARRGFATIAVARRKARLDDLAAEVASDGGICVPVSLDVMQAGAAERIVEVARSRFNRIDVIVNAAGYATAGGLLQQTDALLDEQWRLHVGAPLRLTRAALPLLRESSGQVFFVGSGAARVPPPYYGAYCAAKAGIRAAAIQLRRELRGTGIAVTYVDPGAVQTEFMQVAGIEPKAIESLRADAKRVGARIVDAIRTRPARVNAVPLHTFGAMLGEWFPALADSVLARREAPPVPAAPAPAAAAVEPTTPAPPVEPEDSEFERALEPVARRMERVKLPATFLAELLRPGEDVHLTDAAMRWAGMPNKNERAALAEALEALTAGGFLERTGDETWRVVRSAH